VNKLLPILLIFSISFSNELTVEGDLTVTGNIQNQTIDSLLQVIADLQSQLSAMQSSGGLETRIYQLPEIIFNSSPESEILDLNEITGYDLDVALVSLFDVDEFEIYTNDEESSSFSLQTERHNIYPSGTWWWSNDCDIGSSNLSFNNSHYTISSSACVVNEHNRFKISYGGGGGAGFSGTFTATIAVTAQFPN